MQQKSFARNSRLTIRRIALISILFLLSAARAPLFAQQTVASVTLSSGWATFGQAVPQGLAPASLAISGVATQTDVKSRWPDGSVKFAIVTAKIVTGGAYTVMSAPAATGTFTPTIPQVSATFTIAGVGYTATLPSTPSSDRWLSGTQVYEGRTTIAPVSGATPHPFLRVNFDTRVYADGTGRLDVSVENVLNQTGATTITYDVTMSVNGAPVFTRAALKHFYLTRWRKTFPINAAVFATITPDIRPFNTARILPPYLSQVSNVVSSPTGTAFDLLGPGSLNPDMPAHGGRTELAPYPDWTARYLVHKNATQRTYVLANGDLSGSWPVHVREAENSTKLGVGSERLVSLDQRPTFWYDQRAQAGGNDFVKGTPLPIREYSGALPTALQTALTPDNAHQPSIAYVPYLLTGDRYYAEEMAFWANYSMLRTYPGDGIRNSAGILESNETRGFGWALRNLAEAAALYPDSSPVKAYLSQKVTNNLQWLDTYANAQNPTTNPFKILWLGMRPDGTQFISMWEQNYLAYAIDRASKLGFSGGLAHRDAIARFQVRLLTSDPEYPRAQGAPYIVAVGPPVANVGWDDYPTYPFFTTMGQIWGGTVGNERPFAGYYGPEARLNVMMGVEAGWPGAQGAYDYLWPFIGVQAVWGSLSDLAQRAGWALDFYPATTAPTFTSELTIDAPAGNSTVAAPFNVSGWSVNRGATTGTGIDAIHIYATPAGGGAATFLGAATYGTARGDIGTMYGTQFTNSGFALNGVVLSPGAYTVSVYGHNARTGAFDVVRSAAITVSAPVSRPLFAVDTPAASSTVTSAFEVGGWALDLGAPSGTGVDAIQFYIFPNDGASPGVYVGTGSYGTSRPDVGAMFGAQFTNSGFHFTITGMMPGRFLLGAYAHNKLTNTFSMVQTVHITVNASVLMSIDVPSPESIVTDAALWVSGWAIDRNAAAGTGVDAVHIYAYPNPGSNTPPIFLGIAGLGIARPDVGALYGARFVNSGYTLTVPRSSVGLTSGTYNIAVWARSTATGAFNNVAVVRITIP